MVVVLLRQPRSTSYSLVTYTFLASVSYPPPASCHHTCQLLASHHSLPVAGCCTILASCWPWHHTIASCSANCWPLRHTVPAAGHCIMLHKVLAIASSSTSCWLLCHILCQLLAIASYHCIIPLHNAIAAYFSQWL